MVKTVSWFSWIISPSYIHLNGFQKWSLNYENINSIVVLTGKSAMGPVDKNFCHATTFSVIWKLMSYNNEGGLEKTSGVMGGSHPDPEIRGGGGCLKNNFVSAQRASVWSKNGGGLPWIRHCTLYRETEPTGHWLCLLNDGFYTTHTIL